MAWKAKDQIAMKKTWAQMAFLEGMMEEMPIRRRAAVRIMEPVIVSDG